MMKPPLRFGLLGTGSIAAEFAHSLGIAAQGTAEAVASRDPGRAASFAARYGVRRPVPSYEALLADPDVDVVYVATPHTEHARWTKRAIRAGKAVLCEKPLAVNEAQAREVIDEATRYEAMLLEAFAFRFHPQTTAIVDLVREGAVGDLGAIDVTFSFDASVTNRGNHRLTANRLAGGGILDVGCYCTSMSRLIAAAATGIATVEPDDVVGLAALDATERTDRYAMAILRFPGDVLAQLSCGVGLAQDDHVRVYGSAGDIHVSQPCWLGGRRDASSVIEVRDDRGKRRTVEIPGGQDIMALEIDAFAAMTSREHSAFAASWRESLANMRTLDRWRRAVGVHYDLDQSSA